MSKDTRRKIQGARKTLGASSTDLTLTLEFGLAAAARTFAAEAIAANEATRRKFQLPDEEREPYAIPCRKSMTA
jgi:hypothetical protein